MIKLLTILGCIGLGMVLKKVKQLPKDLYLKLNRVLIRFFIPILILLHIPETVFTKAYIWPVLSAWLVFFGSVIFFFIIGKWKAIDRSSLGGLTVTAGIGSISFVGFPIFEMLFGSEGLKIGIIMSTLGTFVICITAGILVSSWFAAKQPNLKSILIPMLKFPPFVAFAIALVLHLSAYEHPEWLRYVLVTVNSIFPFLALITIGLAINFSFKELRDQNLLLGLSYKLLVAPILIFIFFYVLIGKMDLTSKICIMAAGIGSMNTIAIIAMELDLNPTLCSKMVGIGIPISIPLLFVINFLLSI